MAEIEINGLFVHDYMMLGRFKGRKVGDGFLFILENKRIENRICSVDYSYVICKRVFFSYVLFLETKYIYEEYIASALVCLVVWLNCMSQIQSRVCLNYVILKTEENKQ